MVARDTESAYIFLLPNPKIWGLLDVVPFFMLFCLLEQVTTEIYNQMLQIVVRVRDHKNSTKDMPKKVHQIFSFGVLLEQTDNWRIQLTAIK